MSSRFAAAMRANIQRNAGRDIREPQTLGNGGEGVAAGSCTERRQGSR